MDINGYMDHIRYKYTGLKAAISAACKGKTPEERWEMAEILDYAISIAEDAESMARGVGYKGPGIYDEYKEDVA